MKNIWWSLALAVAACCVFASGPAWAQGWDWSDWDKQRDQMQQEEARQKQAQQAAPKARTLGERLKAGKKDMDLGTLESLATPAPAAPAATPGAIGNAPPPKPESWVKKPAATATPKTAPTAQHAPKPKATPMSAAAATPKPTEAPKPAATPKRALPQTSTAAPKPLPAFPSVAREKTTAVPQAVTDPAPQQVFELPQQRLQTSTPKPLPPYVAPAPAAPPVPAPASAATAAPTAAPTATPTAAPTANTATDRPEPLPAYKPAVRASIRPAPAASAGSDKPDTAEAARTESSTAMLSPQNDVERTRNAVLASPEVEHFLAVAMYDHDEQRFHRDQRLAGSPLPRVLTRWDTDVRVGVMGDATPRSLDIIKRSIERIDATLPVNGGVRALFADAEPNVSIYIFPKAPSTDIKAYSTLRHEGATITGGEIVLYQDMLTEGVVLRELLRALGFQGDDMIDGTLMHPERPGSAGSLTELDKRALKILYGARLKTGMSMDQVRSALR